MICMGALGVIPIGMRAKPTPIGWAIAGVLVATGALLFLRRPFTWWLALAASALTLVTGVLAQLGKPQWALPVPAVLSIVIGLYLLLRLVIARSYFQPKGFLPKSDE